MPSAAGGFGDAVGETGTGADREVAAGMFAVVSGGVWGGDKGSDEASISPVQATTVWFHGDLSDER